MVPTKFYVVNDATADQTFEYDANGKSVESYNLAIGNTAPRRREHRGRRQDLGRGRES